jgi:5-histidylcysteine sulfoxide synthase/putative 4-mercaptohistidine N1-methyltranferase
MDLRNTRTPILNQGTADEKREEIRRYFNATFTLDEQLYDTLVEDKAFYLRPEPLRHPLVFYLGHTATFYVNKLIVAKIIEERINPRFESMFAVGVDEMSWDDLNQANYDWPTVAEVKDYRKEVRALVNDVICSLPLNMPVHWDHPFWAVLMGIEHERIHIETSSVIIRRMPIELVRQLPQWDICRESGPAPENELLPVAGGHVILGKPRNDPLYGWDNEYGRQMNDVWDFSASKYLVSNQEYLGFVEDHGYENEEYWTEEGRKWVEFTKARHPLFWIEVDGTGVPALAGSSEARLPKGGTPARYKFRTIAQIIDMPWNWPVEVNQLEAKAFCNWMAAKTGRPIRLPTEAEWRRLHDLHNIPDQPYWEKAPGNINLEHWASSCPVDRFQFGEFFDIIGNVWQWTETPITGFDGFEIHPYYDDFSTPTFDTRHNLIKGGSWISTGNYAIRDSRYAFRRHFFQHAGLRYVESEQPVAVPEAMYESDAAVSQYCEAHFGKTYYNVPNFMEQSARICIEHARERPRRKALDLGCAVGRGTFELAREFDFVTGIDFSARFIRIALQLKEKGVAYYDLAEEGEIVSYHEARLSELGLERTIDRVEFLQGDATNLKPQFTGYDLILAANLVDRLYDPKGFLATIHERLNVGGLLVMTSPYTWLEEFTKKENWAGGIRKAGEPYWTFDALKELLGPHFNLLEPPRDVEFVIRETRRKFQHTLSEVTVWERVR